MAPKRNPTQTATVHSTDTDTSAGQVNNQAVTRRDLEMLAQNLTATFSKQLRAVMSTNNPAQQRALDDMANQIRNLQDRVAPRQDASNPQTSPDGNTRMSRSSRRNRSVGLLGFDDDFTLIKQIYFRDYFVGIYPILFESLLKPMTWFVEQVRVKNIQEVRKLQMETGSLLFPK